YLRVERRLVAGSVDNYVQLARRFLDFCAQQGVADLAGGKAGQLSGFFLSQGAPRPRGAARRAGTPLRALLRFGQLRGLTSADLALAVPRAANRRGAGLPRSLPLRDFTQPPPSSMITTQVGPEFAPTAGAKSGDHTHRPADNLIRAGQA